VTRVASEVLGDAVSGVEEPVALPLGIERDREQSAVGHLHDLRDGHRAEPRRLVPLHAVVVDLAGV
jgi:hypothetical protein